MKITTHNIILSGMIAAAYAVMAIMPPFSALSFGLVQFRLAEALMILCIFTPCGVWGTFIGCLVANAIGAGNLFDIIFGSLATLAAGTVLYKWRYFFRQHKFFAPIPITVINAVVVGLYLPFILSGATSISTVFSAILNGNASSLLAISAAPVGICILSVAIGEGVVTYLLGVPFAWFLEKRRFF